MSHLKNRAWLMFGEIWRLGSRHSVLLLSLGLLLVLTPLAPARNLLPQSALNVAVAIQYLGGALVAFNVLRLMAVGKILASVLLLVESIVLLSLALLAVRFAGVELATGIEWARLNPDVALAFFVGALIVQATLSHSSLRFWRGKPAARRRLDGDVRRTAIHEAGHLILFARLKELPDKLMVQVLAEISESDSYRGSVSYTVASSDELTETDLYWLMLMNLAGSQAELLVLGDRGDGGDSDAANWLELATAYLCAGFGEVFYSKPTSEAEISHNRSVLNDLKAAQLADLDTRLNLNKGLLEELARAISANRTLNRDQIGEHLARFKLDLAR